MTTSERWGSKVAPFDLRHDRVALVVRLAVYGLLLCLFLLAQILQPYIYNTGISFPLFGILGVAFLSQILVLQLGEKRGTRNWLKALLALDVLLVTSLLYSTEINDSLFLFLYFIFIFVGGLVFSYTGAFYMALASSLAFTFVNLLDPRIESSSLMFLVLMNNAAFLLSAYLSGFLSRQIDVTGLALKETGLKLKSVENFNDLIMSNIQASVLVFDSGGVVQRANDSASHLFPQLKNNVASTSTTNLFSNFRGAGVFANPRENLEESFEIYGPATDGRVGVYRGQISAMDPTLLGEPLFILLLQDVTKVKQLEERLRQNEKLAAVGGLAAGIAHEIRNPLASISGSIQMLRQSSEQPDDLRLMNIVLKETDRLDGLITEFLDYARPEEALEDEFRPTDLLRGIVEQLKLDKSLDQGVQVKLNLKSDSKILGAKDKLKQAFMNIIINAYHALAGVAGPTLHVSVQDIPGGKIQVLIADNGCGMDEKIRSRIFEPFLTTKPKGTGLGLAVTHKILQSHQADVQVSSVKGSGTQFEITLPKLG